MGKEDRTDVRLSTDDDLDKAWSMVVAECNHITDWDLSSRDATSVDLLVDKITAKSSKSTNLTKAKAVFRTTLVCIERFGQVAAQTAGLVFGPSQECMNAVSFVIKAVDNVSALYNDITTLMERVSTFLERLKIYLDDNRADVKLVKELRKPVYQVLEHFLRVMARTHKLTRGWGKMKAVFKVSVFGDDDGIKSALTKMELQISYVTSTEVSLIFRGMSGAARDLLGIDKKLETIAQVQEKANTSLEKLETAEEGRRADKEHRARLEALKELLNIDTNKRSWADRQNDLCGQRVDGTGDWLLQHEVAPTHVPRWTDPTSYDMNVIALNAGQGYGKSFLSSTLIEHLQEKHKDNQRVSVAYYYLQRDAQDEVPLNTAVKAIIWQLASSASSASTEYLKLISHSFASKDLGRPAVLWQRFIRDIAHDLDATFFIILDGFNDTKPEVSDPFAQILEHILVPDKNDQLKIRLFFTGRPECLSNFTQKLPIPNIKLMALGDDSCPNEKDVMLYTHHQLDQLSMFHDGKNDKEVEMKTELKMRAKELLSAGARGDYVALQNKLDDLKRSQTYRAIEDVLSSAKQSREMDFAISINKLNESLTSEDIRQVNELLLWVYSALADIDVVKLESILTLKANTESLISLERQIDERYYTLFNVDTKDKIVSLRSDVIADLLTTEQAGTALNSKLQKIASSTQKPLEVGEVELVRRSLRIHLRNTFGGDYIYEKFGFEAFFTTKLGVQAQQLVLGPAHDRHIHIVRACLTAICDSSGDAEYTAFHDYAYEWFADHLAKTNVALVDEALRQEIGRKLARVVTEDRLIDLWWNTERMKLDQYWVYETLCSKAVYTWLEDPVVQRGFLDMPTQRQWLSTVYKEPKAVRKVLQNVAVRMAQRWFDQGPLSQKAFSWLLGYFCQGFQLDEEDDPPVRQDPTAFQIETIEQQAAELLHNADSIYQWHMAVAATTDEYRFWDDSILRYEDAIKLRPDDWKAKLGLGRALERSYELPRAAEVVTDLLESHTNLLDVDEAYTTKYYEHILGLLGKVKLDLENPAGAEEVLSKQMNGLIDRKIFPRFKAPTMFTTLDLVKALADQDKYGEIMDLFVRLHETRKEDSEVSYLTTLLQLYGPQDEFHRHIHAAAIHTERTSFVIQQYRAAAIPMEALATRSDTEIDSIDYLNLSYHYASLLYAQGTREGREEAVALWEHNLKVEMQTDDKNEDRWVLDNARDRTAKKLAVSLLDLAKESGLAMPFSAETSGYVTRLEKLVSDNAKSGSEEDLSYCLARLYHLAGDDEKAKIVLRAGVELGLERLDDRLISGATKVFAASKVLDDDNNAIVAQSVLGRWTQQRGVDVEAFLAPLPASSNTESSVFQDAAANTGRSIFSKSEISAEQSASEIYADNALYIVDDNILENRLINTSECNGRCGQDWNGSSGAIYSCRDCLDVMLEENCYQKLLTGELDPTVCNPRHSHFKITPFNENAKGTKAEQHRLWLEAFLPDGYTAIYTGEEYHFRYDEDGEVLPYFPYVSSTAHSSRPGGVVFVKDRLIATKEWTRSLKAQYPGLRARQRFIDAIKKVQNLLQAGKILGNGQTSKEESTETQ